MFLCYVMSVTTLLIINFCSIERCIGEKEQDSYVASNVVILVVNFDLMSQLKEVYLEKTNKWTFAISTTELMVLEV